MRLSRSPPAHRMRGPGALFPHQLRCVRTVGSGTEAFLPRSNPSTASLRASSLNRKASSPSVISLSFLRCSLLRLMALRFESPVGPHAGLPVAVRGSATPPQPRARLRPQDGGTGLVAHGRLVRTGGRCRALSMDCPPSLAAPWAARPAPRLLPICNPIAAHRTENPCLASSALRDSARDEFAHCSPGSRHFGPNGRNGRGKAEARTSDLARVKRSAAPDRRPVGAGKSATSRRHGQA